MFARLFPAMQEPAEQPQSFVEENDYSEERTPSVNANGPTPTRPIQPFQLPAGAFTPPSPGIETLGGYSPAKNTDDDPLGIDTLVRIGQASAKGQKYDDRTDRILDRVRPIDTSTLAAFGQGPPETGQQRSTSNIGSDGQPYRDPADQPPPELPASMRPQSALEAARKRFEEVNRREVVDKDKGVKGRVYEAISNALEGMSMAYRNNPNAHWSASAAGGGAGALAGATLGRDWNERREHSRELGDAKRQYDIANETATDQEKLAVSASKRSVDEYEAMTKREKLIYDQLDENKKNVLSQLRDIDEIDPDSKDPRVQAFIKQASDAGIVIQKKSKNSKFSFDITPDGQLIIGDTTTGSYKKGEGNYSKPASFSANELPDELFGLKSDKEIDDEATAAVRKEFPNRRLRPELATNLKGMVDENGNPLYANPDGSINEAKAFADGVIDEKGYENSPDNYEQRRAGARSRMRASQAALRTEVANFRTAVSNQRPRSDAQEQPISKVKDLFLRIMALPPKQRSEKLKAFYANLSNIRITG